MRSAALLVAAVVATIAGTSPSSATEVLSTSEKLIGWSIDGARWVTIRSESSGEPDSLVIHDAGAKPVATFCTSAEGEGEGPGEGCDAARDLGIELERVDLVGHEKLRQYKLVRLSPAMRSVFKMFFAIEHGALGGGEANCVKTFTLAPLFFAPDIEVTAPNCLTKVIGGFVHPDARRVLVKIEMDWNETDDGELTGYSELTYQLVDL